VFVRSIITSPTGSRITISSSWGDGDIEIPLLGDFNIANVVEVLALLLSWGIDFSKASAVISDVKAPPGRMQNVAGSGVGSVPSVLVDYAHTPAALEAALRALRGHAQGNIWCVFGCGGDRDRGKRPQMGKIASQLADRAIVTSDNPRFETPEKIIADVLAGMDEHAIAIESRAAAIDHAIRSAAPNDVILIAGKGHEDYQLIGDKRIDFSDYDVALASIDARSNVENDQ
jgi:UDP-N-acetylmuramoyl-L-alanyl-D-glutamate--2,6-diaminopimelate ligase